MKKELLLEEKEFLENNIKKYNDRLEAINKSLKSEIDEKEEIKLDLAPWRKDILWLVADIFRTSPINVNYPYGYDCNTCMNCHNECTTDGEGCDCNWAFMHYIEMEIENRKERYGL